MDDRSASLLDLERVGQRAHHGHADSKPVGFRMRLQSDAAVADYYIDLVLPDAKLDLDRARPRSVPMLNHIGDRLRDRKLDLRGFDAGRLEKGPDTMPGSRHARRHGSQTKAR